MPYITPEDADLLARVIEVWRRTFDDFGDTMNEEETVRVMHLHDLFTGPTNIEDKARQLAAEIPVKLSVIQAIRDLRNWYLVEEDRHLGLREAKDLIDRFR